MNGLQIYLIIGLFLAWIYLSVFGIAYTEHIKEYPKLKKKKKILFVLFVIIIFGWPLIAFEAWVKQSWYFIRNIK